MDPRVFKAYDNRGIYLPGQLTEQDAWIVNCAAPYERRWLVTQTVCVRWGMGVGDTPLPRALIEGTRLAGVVVIDIGAVDTSQVYFVVNRCRTSLDPARYNGCKIAGRGFRGGLPTPGGRGTRRKSAGQRDGSERGESTKTKSWGRVEVRRKTQTEVKVVIWTQKLLVVVALAIAFKVLPFVVRWLTS